MAIAKHGEIIWSDADVVNIDDYPATGVGCGNYRAFLLHDHGFSLAVVFAETASDAIDIAADAGKLDLFKVADSEIQGMTEAEQDRLSFRGNHGNPFDLDCLDVVELPPVPVSFAALFNAAHA